MKKASKKYENILIDKNNITYFSNSVFGLFMEIMWHRLKFWKKGKKWLH